MYANFIKRRLHIHYYAPKNGRRSKRDLGGQILVLHDLITTKYEDDVHQTYIIVDEDNVHQTYLNTVGSLEKLF